MKKIVPAGIIIALLTISSQFNVSAQKVSMYQCKWHEGQAASEEDMVNHMQLDEKSQFLYMVTNDDKNLYIDLITADRNAIQKIMRYGMTTWFNTQAKHKKELGIEFPVTAEGMKEPQLMQQKSMGESRSKSDMKEMRQAMMAGRNREMTLIDFEGRKERKVIDPQTDPLFQGKVEMMEGGKLWISLTVPLEKLGRGTAVTNVSPISLGFETGYMDLTRSGYGGGGMQGGGDTHGGGMHGGGGGRPGGGPPGGGQMGMQNSNEQQQRPDINELSSPSRLWIKQLVLAKQQ